MLLIVLVFGGIKMLEEIAKNILTYLIECDNNMVFFDKNKLYKVAKVPEDKVARVLRFLNTNNYLTPGVIKVDPQGRLSISNKGEQIVTTAGRKYFEKLNK